MPNKIRWILKTGSDKRKSPVCFCCGKKKASGWKLPLLKGDKKMLTICDDCADVWQSASAVRKHIG